MPDGVGRINFATSFISYFIVLSSFGISSYGFRAVAHARDNKELLSKTVHELFLVNIVATLVSYASLLVIVFSNKQFYDAKELIFILSSMIVFTTISLDWVYIGLEQYLVITLRALIFPIISLLLMFAYVKTKDDYLKYALITVFSVAASSLFNFFYIKKFIYIKLYRDYNLIPHIKGTWNFFVMAILANVFAKLDNTFLTMFSSYGTVGLFSSANKLIMLGTTILGSVNNIFVARFSYYLKNKQQDAYNNSLNTALYFITLITIPCVFGMEMLSKDVVMLLMGSQFQGSIVLCRILAPTLVFSMLSLFFSNQVLYAHEADKKLLVSNIFFGLLSLVLNVILIPKFHDWGAAFSVLLSTFGGAVIVILYSKPYLRSSIKSGPVFRSVAAAIIMSVIIYSTTLLSNSSLVRVLSSVPVGIVTYFSVLLILKEPLALQVLEQLIGRIRGQFC
ncbi:MAG: polysaccharide biosynthesis C-terminal domain-containing protein [Chitinispirillaceae bacterium]|nr:polysaccharide biosynthesis C-terminal domain-containing protein [Chitinispirillaceae bacterium]